MPALRRAAGRSMRFQDLETFTNEDVEAAIVRDDPDELLRVPIAVSLSAPDPDRAQGVCLRLSEHAHPNVRGNAVLGEASATLRTCGSRVAYLQVQASGGPRARRVAEASRK